MNALSVTQATKQKIVALLDELPPESLTAVEKFVEFLRQQAQDDQIEFLRMQARQRQPLEIAAKEEKPPYLYPTVENPASSLSAWLDLIPGGCGGDALADTEALYDEV